MCRLSFVNHFYRPVLTLPKAGWLTLLWSRWQIPTDDNFASISMDETSRFGTHLYRALFYRISGMSDIDVKIGYDEMWSIYRICLLLVGTKNLWPEIEVVWTQVVWSYKRLLWCTTRLNQKIRALSCFALFGVGYIYSCHSRRKICKLIAWVIHI